MGTDLPLVEVNVPRKSLNEGNVEKNVVPEYNPNKYYKKHE